MNAYRLRNTDYILNIDKVNLLRLDENKIEIYFENSDAYTLTFESVELAEECFIDLSNKLEKERK